MLTINGIRINCASNEYGLELLLRKNLKLLVAISFYGTENDSFIGSTADIRCSFMNRRIYHNFRTSVAKPRFARAKVLFILKKQFPGGLDNDGLELSCPERLELDCQRDQLKLCFSVFIRFISSPRR
nr:hypothetical transcript [Hymenolepis microstoma]